MTTHDDVTPESSPRANPLEVALGELVRGQQANTRALGVIGRDIESLKVEIGDIATKALAVSETSDRVTEEFSRLHGIIQGLEHAEAEERRKMHQDIRLILNEVRNLAKRMGPVESRVAGLELQLSLAADDGH